MNDKAELSSDDMRVLKSLVKEPREAIEIAVDFDLDATTVFAHLENLLRRGWVEERPAAGFYQLSEPGRLAASSPTALDFDTITKRLNEQKRVLKSLTMHMSADNVIVARKAEFPCGCAAYIVDPPSDDPGMRFLACSVEHVGAVEGYRL
jgi:hypothetical protein